MERAPITSVDPLPSPERRQRKIHLPQWILKMVKTMTIAERIGLIFLFILLVISGVISSLNYVESHTQLIPKAGGIYREAAVGQPRYINPIVASANDLDADLTRLVYTGLFRFDGDLNLVNDLAESVESTEGEKHYTIRLREGIYWHDGKPLTADDVVFTIRSIQTPDYGSPLATAFQGVTVEKVDDLTVLFKLKEAYAPFLTSLTTGIVPQHVWSEIEPQNATLAEQILKPIGTGPYKFSEISTRRKTGDITSYRLVRNEQYYGDRPYIDEIIFYFFNSLDEAYQALLSDRADGIGFLPLDYVATAMEEERFTINRLLIPQYFAVFFNSQKNEALSEAGVRSALSLTVDRQQVVEEALLSQGVPLHLPIPPAILSYEGEFNIPEVNFEAAEQNLTDSGWVLGDDGIRQKDGKKLAIKLTTTDWPEYVRTAEILRDQWSKLGIDVSLEHFSVGTIQQSVVQPRDYEALIFGEILPADPDPYPFWHSTQTRSPGLNLSLLKNKEVDKLLEEARKTLDLQKRQEMYKDFQNKIIELSPAVILYQPYYLFITNNVLGIDPKNAALPAGRFNNIEKWHVLTERVWK